MEDEPLGALGDYLAVANARTHLRFVRSLAKRLPTLLTHPRSEEEVMTFTMAQDEVAALLNGETIDPIEGEQ